MSESYEKSKFVSENNKLLVKINDLETSLEGTSQALDRAEKKTVDLEKKNKWYSEQVCFKECAEVWGQLEQANEIIRKMLFALSDNRASFMSNPYYDLEEQAKQFLNLSEKATN